jgi:hypothetical protein
MRCRFDEKNESARKNRSPKIQFLREATPSNYAIDGSTILLMRLSFSKS